MITKKTLVQYVNEIYNNLNLILSIMGDDL